MKTKLNEKHKIVDLFDNDDFNAISTKYFLTCTLDELKKNPSLLFNKVSFTTFIIEYLSSNGETVHMLSEVIDYISRNISKTRTTGGILMLKEDYEYNSQMVEAILDFSKYGKFKKIHVEEKLKSITDQIHQTLKDLLKAIAFNSRRTNNNRRGYVKFETKITYNKKALIQTTEFINNIENIIQSISCSGLKLIDEFIDNVKEEIKPVQKIINGEKYEIRCGNKLIDQKIEFVDLQERCRIIKEEIFNIFKLLDEKNDYSDVIRFDLFRNRPQLYEVWILVKILKALEKTGDISFLCTKQQNGKLIWNLNYSKSSRPIAQIHQPCGNLIRIYYQFFIKGEKSSNMPDIVISSNEYDWVLDPKHSFKGSYSKSDYEEVCLRYYDTFKPKEKSLILEYFCREDLGITNPEVFKEGCELITDVSPKGKGLKTFISNITYNQKIIHQTIYIIDVSDSYIGNFTEVISDISKSCKNQIHEIILFSDKAMKYTDIDEIIDINEILNSNKMGGSTNFRVAIEAIGENLFNDKFDCIIYSDYKFSSRDLTTLKGLLNNGKISLSKKIE